MYKIAICDDEPKVLEYLGNKIKQAFSIYSFETDFYLVSDSEVMYKSIIEYDYDILFIDIDMPQYSGMDIAEILLNKGDKTLLVFVTNYDALVYKSFKYKPFAFVRKSFFEAEINQVVEMVVKTLAERQELLTIKANSEIMRIKISEIIFIEAEANYVVVHTKTDKYKYRESLGVLEKKLSLKGFIRIHKGFLVNQSSIYIIRSNEIELNDGHVLPIGRANKDIIKKELMKYMH